VCVCVCVRVCACARARARVCVCWTANRSMNKHIVTLTLSENLFVLALVPKFKSGLISLTVVVIMMTFGQLQTLLMTMVVTVVVVMVITMTKTTIMKTRHSGKNITMIFVW
jgi:hypothetical protein